METTNGLDEVNIIAALLRDVQTSHESVFDIHDYRLSLKKLKSRCRAEGLSFLTKTLPKLGKAFDKALCGHELNCTSLGFKPQSGSKLPKFLGSLFNSVFTPAGMVLQDPCAVSVRVIRQILYLFYKYELPYSHEQEQSVVLEFEKTEEDLRTRTHLLQFTAGGAEHYLTFGGNRYKANPSQVEVTLKARRLLKIVFDSFDPMDILPRHGPGAVATKQQLWEKFRWTNVSQKLTDVYPFDAYFCASPGHVCDTYRDFCKITSHDLPARVILVPKDSRGPRLISCEPVDKQWIQQGLGQAIVRHVERHRLTRHSVHFTNQESNRFGALLGSTHGNYATLDLKEASDRVSLDLVRLLFPETIISHLECCRSSRTVLPDGRELELKKFAPMGSALCFPVLALTVWAILTAAAPDTYTRDRILVYGDDVIVPTAYAANAIEQLELYGLLVNRDKSCTSGLFRESCGLDAFKGIVVTPVRLRTVWSSHPCPATYTSWIAYANSMYDKQYFGCYDLIVSMLQRVYRHIPTKDMGLPCPSLPEVPDNMRCTKTRINHSLQKREWLVLDVQAVTVRDNTSTGWERLLRYFSEFANSRNRFSNNDGITPVTKEEIDVLTRNFDASLNTEAFSVSQYTRRRRSILRRRWR